MIARVLLAVAGVAVAGYGLVLLLDLGVDNLVATGVWVVGGVVAHDALLAPATVLIGVAAGAVLRRPLPGAAVVAAVVLATVTVVAVPVLGRFGARPDNPTLLDRDYGLGWLILAALCLAGGMMGTWVARSRTARGGEA